MNGGDRVTVRVYLASMAFMVDGDDPIEEVMSEVERVYGVRLQVDRGDRVKDNDIEMDARGKQDRT